MKIWPDRFPDFLRRLWCQLAISYTVLAFCAMMLFVITRYGINDYNDFHAALSLDKIEQLVAGEKLIVATAIREADNNEWFARARDNIRGKLTNLEHSSGTSIYRITNSCNPVVYIQIRDRDNRLLMSDPVDPPEKIVGFFDLKQTSPSAGNRIERLSEPGAIWVDMPIMGSDGRVIGRLSVIFVAEFQLWVQLSSILDFLLHSWGLVFCLCLPIGIACGLVAARYVTRQLHKMNMVTESWRQGNFEPRISLPSDDVLIRHGQYLNEMAGDLEKYLVLKQNLAVNDERNRVARELHDTVKQKLFALALQLATAKTKPPVMEAAGDQIQEAATITREAQHDLMEIITQLHPSGTSQVSISNRIGMIADDFMRRFQVVFELEFSENLQCDIQTEHQVLRIVQEASMNAIRHGHANKITIAGQADRGRVTLMIIDNGNGFDPTQSRDGLGLASMRDRALELPNGIFQLESTPGAGAQITFSWSNT